MTTALIGKKGSAAAKARVAMVSRSRAAHLVSVITRSGHEVVECPDWNSLAAALINEPLDLVLYDEELASGVPRGLSAPALLVAEGSVSSGLISLGWTSPASLESALEPLLALAVQLSYSISRCRDMERLFDGVRSGSAMLGRSPIMRRVQSAISRAADCDATVLIEGPPGSGKSLAARIIHCKSRRSDHVLLAVDCEETQPEALGRAIDASKGTTMVFEDIDRLPVASQAILVRHLKERVTGHGGGLPRLIATTSAHIPELVAKGAFREDLYYRLHALPIVMPALRERSQDIATIAEAILDVSLPQAGRQDRGITASARMLLESMPWPGNISQLESTIRRAQVQAGGGQIDREHLMMLTTGATPQTAPSAVGTSRSVDIEQEPVEASIRPFEEEEQMLLSRALRATKGNVRRAAQLLGIGRATLYRKIQQYHLRLQ